MKIKSSTYIEQEDGRAYFVDGGLSYSRLGYSDMEYTNLSVYSDDPHELIRERFEWVKLKDIKRDHLMALLDWTENGYPDKIHKVFIDELKWRGCNGSF